MPVQQDIIQRLQREILQLQGSRPPAPGQAELGLGPIQAAFPHQNFPTGAIHEFVGPGPADTAATAGFTAGLISGLMRQGGICIWVSAARKIYPPGLKAFGVAPDRVIFMDMRTEKEVWWVMEESLKCEGLAAVVGEMKELDMTVSRRFQLATEQSRVTGLVLRQQPRKLHPNAAVARWQVTHLPSVMQSWMPGPGLSGPSGAGHPMPGVGFPRWNIELSRIRNGHPGSWVVEWQAGRFHFPVVQAGGSRRADGQTRTGGQAYATGQALDNARAMTG
jgi:protein ImuA